ncbi:MAG TPA: DUF167 domain-containing protein [Patescibacteria group bacterium]|nr:DUF167 domain-containing protein [Patescibacteria group bacterium]
MLLSVHLIPNARQNEIIGWVQGALKIKIAAPPIEGRANKALIEFLAEVFDLAPSEIEIEKGASSKYKRINIPLTKEDIDAFLKK